MPELPEVETVVRDLRPNLVGRRLGLILAGRKRLRQPWSKTWNEVLHGRSVEEVSRRGKWIIVRVEGGPHLVIHLGMTGQLRVVPTSAALAGHTHLVLQLDDGQQLRFRDPRRFGGATVLGHPDALVQFFQDKGLGPEPFDLDCTYWQKRLSATDRCLKAILLDQRVIAGVGNIYADESLFAARLHPARSGRSLSRVEAGRLRKAIVAVLERAIESRGSSIRTFVDGHGLKGSFQEKFSVYGRTGQSCPRCCTSVECLRLAGRSTHFCPHCQRR